MRHRAGVLVISAMAMTLLFGQGSAGAQNTALSNGVVSLDQTGQISFEGRVMPYRIRNLPVSSFPELPQAIAAALSSRGCIIPQTYQAKRPENVIHGSFARAGSADWAVLCSAHEQVMLLVFFAGASTNTPTVLRTRSWKLLLELHAATGELGFDWGIDPASPRQIHDAQAAMPHRPPAPDHDAVAETTIDRDTVYHLYRNGAWETVATE